MQMNIKRKNAVRWHRITAACLALITTIPLFSVGISAFAIADEHISYRTKETLTDGMILETLHAEKDNAAEEGYLFTFTPGKAALPIVTAGKGVWGRETATTMTNALVKDGYAVLGGVNADFFSMKTGIPMGVMMMDGVILSSDAGENAIGMKQDGSMIIGCPKINITLHKTQKTDDADKPLSPGIITGDPTEKTVDIPVNHINKYPSIWGAYLCTPDFDKTTHSTEKGTEIVFRLDEGSFVIDKSTQNPAANGNTGSSTGSSVSTETKPIKATVTEIRTDAINGAIPDDGFVIVIHNSAANANKFRDFSVGETVTFTCTAANGWEDVVFAVGGGDILVDNGAAKTEGFSAEHADKRHPRTAVGYTADGNMLVFAVDGRTGASEGMTLAELARTMRDFGCISALNLDGGGSTTVLVRERDGAFLVANNPTDGYERTISNALLFVNTAEPDGVPCFAEITPDAPIVYRDTAIPLSIAFYDKSYAQVSCPEANVTWVSDGGIIKDGVLTPSSPNPGVITVSAQVHIPMTEQKNNTAPNEAVTEKIVTVSTKVYQVDKLDSIQTAVSALEVPFGGISDPISVTGVWKGRKEKVHIHPSYLTVAFAPDDSTQNKADLHTCAYGSIDSTLSVHNTASAADPAINTLLAKSGFPQSTLTFSLTDSSTTHTTSIPVTFGAAPQIVMDMEEKDVQNRFSVPSATDTVSRLAVGGRGDSAAVAVAAPSVSLTKTPPSQTPVKRMDLYVKGTLPNVLQAVISYHGTAYTLPWTVTDDFTRLDGWKRISLDLTAIAPNGIRDFTINTLLTTQAADSTSTIEPEKFSLTIDNLVYDFGDALPVFCDIADSWAKDSILSVARMQVVGGIPMADGTYAFRPTGLLTRAEFAKMICVFAGLTVPEAPTEEELFPPTAPASQTPPDPTASAAADARANTDAADTADTQNTQASDTAGTQDGKPAVTDPGSVTSDGNTDSEKTPDTAATPYLPFTDLADIPAWALPYIKAVTEAGLMRGKSTGAQDAQGNAILRFAASDTMTRAEVLQVLGTLLPDGTTNENTTVSPITFADSASIPAWAKINIDRCVGAGIVSGFEDNTIRPNATITRAEIAALLVRTNNSGLLK
ncbi:MAG: phosphodiester glycosidase family protein [Clostridia bacterium]|nr:phosphodiester glycosidase family protein [Clostridia bacterium]